MISSLGIGDAATWSDAAPLWPFVAFLVGLIVGSFANVLIHRLPRGQSIVTPGSRCPRCGAPVRAFDNIPVLSWLLLLGRCRSCRAPISVRYPLVEAANGLLWLLVALVHAPSPQALVTLALVSALLVLTLTDLEHQILPDAITLPGTAAGLAASFLPGSPLLPRESLIAAAAGYLGFFAVAEVWRRARGVEALGQGDWKMAAMLGAFFGWQGLLLIVFFATLAGSLIGGTLILRGRGDLQSRLPLGSFLGAAALIAIFVGEPVLAWYRGLLDV